MPDKTYCYPNSDVLINKLNIRNQADLFEAEKEFIKVFAENYGDLNALHPFRDDHVIIRTKLEKPSKINGLALI